MLLSACVIARNEAERIARCIGSVLPAVDEVVVYDTGSTDDTPGVASAAGATVVTGSWPGSFAEARNAALGHCRGDWVLSIDADEQLVCAEPALLRDRLQRIPEGVLGLQVSIHNRTGSGNDSGYLHTADRLFRRRSCRWKGRLHEQLVDAVDGTFPPVQPVEEVSLTHDGYLHQVEMDRGKAARNLELARAEVHDPSFGDRGLALVWLGRALWAADQPEEALTVLLEGSRTTSNPRSRRQGLESAARISLRLGRLDQAEEAIAGLRAASERQVVADILDAGLCLARRRPQRALELLERSGATDGPVTDDEGRGYSPGQLLEWRGAALVGSGRPGEAADMIVRSWKANGNLDADLDLLVEAIELAGRSLDEIAAAVTGPSLPGTVAAALRLPPARAERVLQALWSAFEDRADQAVTVLAGAAMLGRILAPPVAGVWSGRLRLRGLDALCPLRSLVSDPTVPPARRLEAASELTGRFEETGPAGQLAGMNSTGAAPQVSWKSRPAAPPELSVVFLAMGGAEHVLGCLQALAPTLPEDRSFEVIAVDPGSRDATAMVLESLDGDVAVVRTPAEVGAVRARNLGIAEARGSVVVIVDASARPRPGWVEGLLSALSCDDTIGAAGPVLSGPEGKIFSAGAAVDPIGDTAEPAAGLAVRPWGSPVTGPRVDWHHQGRSTGPPGPDPVRVDALDPAVVAVRRQALERVGGFDEGYWEGGETIDLCFALRAHGYAVVCAPASRVVISGHRHPGAGPWCGAWPGAGLPPLEQSAGPRLQYDLNRTRFATRWGRPG